MWCFDKLLTLHFWPKVSFFVRVSGFSQNRHPDFRLLVSFSSHNDGSYKDLRTFTASLLVHLGPLSGSSTRWQHDWHWPIRSGLQAHSQLSIFNPAFAVHDATDHVPPALNLISPSPLLHTASATPNFLHASDPSASFFARPSTRPVPFLLDFDLWETFFRRPPLRVLFFGSLWLQCRPFWPTSRRFDLRETSVKHSHFLWWFIFVRSLQSSPDVVCYGSVLFSVAV